MFSPRRGVTKRPPRQCPRLCGAETNRMTTDVVSATLRPGLARPPLRDRLKLEHVVMGGAVVALIVLVVLPLLSLLFGSVKGEEGLSFDHFSEVLSGRLYLTALKNSLILGAWTSLFSLVLGLLLAWAVSRTDVPCKPLDSAHRHALLPVPAVPHGDRADLSVQPQCRTDERADARHRRPSLAHVQHLLHAGAGARDGHAHVPVRLSAGVERAPLRRCLLRGGGADSRRQQAAHGALDHGAAGGARDPLGHAARVRQRACPVRLAGDHRSSRSHLHAADPHLCPVRLSAGIRAGLGAVAGPRADHRGRALPPARIPGAAILRDARRARVRGRN